MNNWSLSLEPEAEADLLDAYEWYERQRIGLGAEFMECVERALEVVLQQPELFAAGHRGLRQAMVKRFPYVICFLIESRAISVIAVLHGHRDPSAWRQRLK